MEKKIGEEHISVSKAEWYQNKCLKFMRELANANKGIHRLKKALNRLGNNANGGDVKKNTYLDRMEDHKDVIFEEGVIQLAYWSQMPIDTPVLVSETGEGHDWHRRHFSGVVDGKVTVWAEGRTYYTSKDYGNCKAPWKYIKFA